MLVTTRSRVESRGLVACGLGLALVTLKCYGLGLVTLKFCGLGLATKELALGFLKMAEFTTLLIFYRGLGTPDPCEKSLILQLTVCKAKVFFRTFFGDCLIFFLDVQNILSYFGQNVRKILSKSKSFLTFFSFVQL